jgi:hypothetical protein
MTILAHRIRDRLQSEGARWHADRISRRLHLGTGVGVLIAADLALVFAQTIWLTAIGAALWGLQKGSFKVFSPLLSPMGHPSDTGYGICYL